MSLFGRLKKIGEAVARTAETVAKVAKDVGTSTVRIVTDVAIDSANVVTGFQFSESMESAKAAMDDAGLKSAATAIRDNHYPEIDTLLEAMKTHRESAQQKVDSIVAQNDAVNKRVALYDSFLSKVSLINQLQTEVTYLLSVTRGELPELRVYESEMGEILRQKPTLSSSGFNATQRALAYGSLAAGIGAALGTATAVASTAAKTVKMAGRASAVLAVAGVGLDVGMAFASYEKQLKQLREAKEKADVLERDLDEDLASLQAHRGAVDKAIETILDATNPRQTEAGYLAWAEASIKDLMDVKAQLEKEARILMAEVLGRLVRGGETNAATLLKVAKVFLPAIDVAEVEELISENAKDEKSWQVQ